MERGLIGAILLKNDLYYGAEVAQLEITDFYSTLTQEIWAELGRLMSESNAAVDVLILGTHLEHKAHLRDKGITGYLIELASLEAAPEPLLAQYVNLIKDTSGLRQLCIASMNISSKALRRDSQKDPKKSFLDLREEAYQEYRGIFDRTAKTQDVFTYKDTPACSGTLEQFIASRSHLSNSILPTPYDELTDLLGGGFKTCGYYIIAARPGMGKTTLALNIADHICKSNRERNHVLILSMEMQADELFQKSLVSETGERWETITNCYSSEARWDNTRAKCDEIQRWPLYLSTPYTLTASELQQAARRTFKLSGGRLGLIIIDYIQLMSTSYSNKHTSNRTQEISEISRAVKGLANELDLPIVVLSQLNRNLEERQDRRPVLSDLRDSGALEQDADVVTFLYRKEVYSKDSEDAGDAELIVAKNRMGPIGHIKLKFEGQYSRFVSQAFSSPKSETLATMFTSGRTTPNTQSVADIVDKVKHTQLQIQHSSVQVAPRPPVQQKETLGPSLKKTLKDAIVKPSTSSQAQESQLSGIQAVPESSKVHPHPTLPSPSLVKSKRSVKTKASIVLDTPVPPSSEPYAVEPKQCTKQSLSDVPETEEMPLFTLRQERAGVLDYEGYGFTEDPEAFESGDEGHDLLDE
jgi:replicative DNA helicase